MGSVTPLLAELNSCWQRRTHPCHPGFLLSLPRQGWYARSPHGAGLPCMTVIPPSPLLGSLSSLPPPGGGVPDTGGWDGCCNRVRVRVRDRVGAGVGARNGLRIGLPGDVPKKRAEKVTFEQVLRLTLAEGRREGNLRTGTTLDIS